MRSSSVTRSPGEVDFVLIVEVENMDAYDRFCDRVLFSDDNLQKFRTLISRQRNKFVTQRRLG